MNRSIRSWLPTHGWLGVGLVLVAWPLNWALPGMRTHVLFFPLWLGYVLTVDGMTVARTASSQWTRSRRAFLGLFILSIPVWWLFELFNQRLRNWIYLGRENTSDLEYILLGSLSFSTVIPAVLGTAELARSWRWIDRFADRRRLRPGRWLGTTLVAAGLAMLALMLIWPRVFFPFLWLFGVALLEPVNRALGRRSLSTDLERGDWRVVMALLSGVLVCGFFWEMWNSLSYPRWIYDIPFFDFARIFEMPALGYLGYLPFALEIYLIRELVMPEADEPPRRDPAIVAPAPSRRPAR